MEVFALLAEPVRRRIIEILETGEHSAGHVADVLYSEFGVSRAASSLHLRILARSDFAISRAQGPYRMYRLHPDALDSLDRAVDRLHELGDARYGWPYLADPLATESVVGVPHPGRGRGHSSSDLRECELELAERHCRSEGLDRGRQVPCHALLSFGRRALDILGRIMDDPPPGRLTMAVQ